MEPHRVLQETAYPSLAYGLFGLGRFLQQIPDSYKRVIFMSICGSIWLSLDIYQSIGTNYFDTVASRITAQEKQMPDSRHCRASAF